MAVNCPYCGVSNRETARFCAQCARPLERTCVQCGAHNTLTARFCNQCASLLTEQVVCPVCGRVNPESARFCENCATPLSATTQPQPPVPPLAPAVSESGVLAPQTLLSGRYQIQRCVGKGGMGAVYQATDTRIQGKKWAVKEMSASAITNPLERQESLANFHQEAMILATLDHPNLPKVVDHFNENGKQYLVMDFIEGETLEERLESAGGGPLPVENVLAWGGQLCDVLDYLHGRNPPIIFRDLKPGNIMVTPEGTVKLIDFGVARFFKSGKAKDTTAFGTAGYAPKEQYGKGQTDPRSDVYALGATLHYLLSGADPAETPFNFEALQRLNPRVPAHVAATIMKALADTPDSRWQSAAEMKTALTTVPQAIPKPVQQSVSTPVVTSPPPTKVWSPAPTPAVSNQIVPPQKSRLNFWRGLGLVVLGAILYGGRWLSISDLLQNPFVAALTSFLPALSGILFGPGVGALVGLSDSVGSYLRSMKDIGGDGFHFVISDWVFMLNPLSFLILTVVMVCVNGIVPALLVKQPRNWKAVLGVGILVSILYILIWAIYIGVEFDAWDLYIVLDIAIRAIPSHISHMILLPLFTRWLINPVRKRGLYWHDYH